MDTKKISYFVVLLFILFGFYFRVVGIQKNLSFWNDESHAAIYSRGVAQTGLPRDTDGRGRGIYQIGLYYVTGASFKLLGISQTAGRIPSVLVGTILIAVMYLVTKSLTRKELPAILASFIMAFSQIQLAWSTQLRPYIWLELFSLLVFYLGIKSLEKKKEIFDRHFLIAATLAALSYLFHPIGFFNIIFLFCLFSYKSLIDKKWWYLLSIIPLGFVTFFLIYFAIGRNMTDLLAFVFKVNTNTLHYRVFLRANYDWLLLGAGFGALYLYTIQKRATVVLTGFIGMILALSIFKINASYVRYCLPAFPLLYILFCVGIDGLSTYSAKYLTNKRFYIIFFFFFSSLFLFIPIKKDKILFSPRFFYTINGDMRENPILDYQKAFEKISVLIKGKKSLIVMDAWNDRIPWYLPGKKYIFLVKNEKSIDPTFNEPMVGTIKGFEDIKKRYQSGVVIVENWESLTPYDLQQHIRNTLKHEFDVQNLPYNEADRWGISIYSWGL